MIIVSKRLRKSKMKMALWALIQPLDETKQNSFILSIIVNVYCNILAVVLLKTDSIDMEIIKQFWEKEQQREVNIGKYLNKMMWSQSKVIGQPGIRFDS